MYAVIVVLAVCILLVASLASAGASEPGLEDWAASAQTQLALGAALLGLHLLVAALFGLAHASSGESNLQLLIRELGVFALTSATVVVVLQMDVYCMLNLAPGHPPDGSAALLLASLVVAVTHLLLPIRWCIAWAIAAVTICIYGLLVATGDSEVPSGVAAVHLPILMLFLIVLSLAERRAEGWERQAFLYAVCKGQVDVDGTELGSRASNKSSEPGVPTAEGFFSDHPTHNPDNASEVPSTTFTGEAFAKLEQDDAEVMKRLQDIANIGRKEHWLLNTSDVKLNPDAVLGSGSFGAVVIGHFRGSLVAVKVARGTRDRATMQHLPALGNELRILRHVRHPNVVLFHGACVDPHSGEIALVLEKVNGTQLDNFLGVPPEPPEAPARLQIIVDICAAVRYLHAQTPRVVHGDLKGSNILVESWLCGPRAKLCDFGLSRVLTRRAKPLGGTLNWMAPEIIKVPSTNPLPAADVFSFGRLSYFVVCGLKPLSGMDRKEIIRLTKADRLPALVWNEHVPFATECRLLCGRCLEKDTCRRPSMVIVCDEVRLWRLNGDSGPPGPTEDTALSWQDGLKELRMKLPPLQGKGRGAKEAGQNHTSKRTAGTSPLPATGRPSGADAPKDAAAQSSGFLPKTQAPLDMVDVLVDEEAVEVLRLSQQGHQQRERATTLPTLPENDEERTTPEATQQSSTLAVPHFKPTNNMMKDIMILDMMLRWNFPYSQSHHCCKYHAAVADVCALGKRLRERPCVQNFDPVSDWQCPKCGLMDSAEDASSKTGSLVFSCDVCGHRA